MRAYAWAALCFLLQSALPAAAYRNARPVLWVDDTWDTESERQFPLNPALELHGLAYSADQTIFGLFRPAVHGSTARGETVYIVECGYTVTETHLQLTVRKRTSIHGLTFGSSVRHHWADFNDSAGTAWPAALAKLDNGFAIADDNEFRVFILDGQGNVQMTHTFGPVDPDGTCNHPAELGNMGSTNKKKFEALAAYGDTVYAVTQRPAQDSRHRILSFDGSKCEPLTVEEVDLAPRDGEKVNVGGASVFGDIFWLLVERNEELQIADARNRNNVVVEQTISTTVSGNAIAALPEGFLLQTSGGTFWLAGARADNCTTVMTAKGGCTIDIVLFSVLAVLTSSSAFALFFAIHGLHATRRSANHWEPGR